jgi:hypothetical protein
MTLFLPPADSELRAIAHHYYMARVRELYAGMEACQDQFRSVAHLQFSLTIPSLFEGPSVRPAAESPQTRRRPSRAGSSFPRLKSSKRANSIGN